MPLVLLGSSFKHPKLFFSFIPKLNIHKFAAVHALCWQWQLTSLEILVFSESQVQSGLKIFCKRILRIFFQNELDWRALDALEKILCSELLVSGCSAQQKLKIWEKNDFLRISKCEVFGLKKLSANQRYLRSASPLKRWLSRRPPNSHLNCIACIDVLKPSAVYE